jgi:PD-(D/E)XK nuclease superfamily protein
MSETSDALEHVSPNGPKSSVLYGVNAQRRRSPYTWCTWATPYLSGDAQCLFTAWMQSQYTFDKVERGGFDLATWKVEHAAMVDKRAVELMNAGWNVWVEDQNKFTIKGKFTTLAGKPDLVATKGSEALVVDCKSGKRRESDVQQVLLYLYALPLYHHAITVNHRVSGEVRYKDGAIDIAPERITPGLRARITDTLKRLGDPTPPAKVPSARECAFCCIPKDLCPERIDTPDVVVETTEF